MTAHLGEQDGPGTRLDRLPWGLSLLLGAAAVTLGVLLATRPLTSLQALALYLGVALLAMGVAGHRSPTGEPGLWDRLRSIALVLLGVITLVWLRHHFELLALVVGAALVIAGGRRLWTAARRGHLSLPDRVASGALGLAEVIIGVLAVRWPDLALLTAAVVFAVRLVLLGVRLIRRGLSRRRRASAYAPAPPGSPWARLVGGALALLLALGAGLLGLQARSVTPTVDAFYVSPEEVPDEPGVLLRSEAFTRDVPQGAAGWRILYTTTAADGSPATASGIVLVPEHGGPGPAPVVGWAHGTTGFATHCAPSLLEHPFEAGALPGLDRVVARDWAVVATAYTGLGTPGAHPYLIGPGEAHSVLDALRAARQLEAVDLAPETVVWGHSQGGHAALWTGQLADAYAPEVELAGIAALAPAADVTTFAAELTDSVVGPLFASYAIAAYAAHYPEITLEEQVIPPAQTLVREMAARCLAEPSIVVSVVSVLSLARDQSVFASPPAEGALGARLRENVPTGPFSVPVLVGQGEADDLILAGDQQDYVDRLCAAGESLTYRTYADRDHVTLIEPDSDLVDDLLRWTTEAFEGAPADRGGGCPGGPDDGSGD